MNTDQRMQLTAQDMINRRGKTITYNSIASGAYNPATSSVSTTTTPYTIKSIVRDASSTDFETGTLVNIGNKLVTIAALAMPVAPNTGDNVTLDGMSYLVYAANPIYSGELPVTYSVRMRHQ